MKTNLIMKVKDNETKFIYIGYYKMLDKILDLMDKCSYENKLNLIDKYIELIRLINKKESKENENI